MNRMMQMELKLDRRALRRCTEAERRRARAAWWFAQMRRVVEEAGRAQGVVPMPGAGRSVPTCR